MVKSGGVHWILYLPHYTPLRVFYACVRDEGLDLKCLEQHVPYLALWRQDWMADDVLEICQALLDIQFLQEWIGMSESYRRMLSPLQPDNSELIGLSGLGIMSFPGTTMWTW